MHESSLLDDLISEIRSIARTNDANRVTCVRVKLGALVHISPNHFREHFHEAAQGTIIEKAKLEIEKSAKIDDPGAMGILLDSIELE